MAAVEITISGVLYDKYNRTQQNVVLIGEASLTGLTVGGGPMPGGPGLPPSGGPPPYPAFPIAPGGPDPGWPNVPGYPPYVSGGPIKPPPDKPPEVTQPPVEWKAVWHPTEGWIVVGIVPPPSGPHPTPSA